MLTAGQFPLSRAALMWMQISLGDVMGVSRLQLFQHRLCRWDRLLCCEDDTTNRNSSQHSYHRGRHNDLSLPIPSFHGIP
jgi:hypothetical protein